MLTDGNAPGTPKNPLTVRAFRLLWLGQAISQIGDQFMIVALSWFVLQGTGSAFHLGAIQAMSTVWSVVFLLIGGLLTDKLQPRWLMITSDAVRALACGLLALFVSGGHFNLAALYIIVAILGAAGATFQPAERSILPSLLTSEQIPAANGLIETTRHGTVVLVPLAAGLVTAWIGVQAGIAVNFLSYLVSIVTLWQLPKLQRGASSTFMAAHERPVGFWKSFGALSDEGRSWAPLLLLSIGLSLAVGSAQLAFPILVHDRTTLGILGLGTVLTVFGASSIAGAVVASLLAGRWRLVHWLTCSTLITAAALFVMALADHLGGLLGSVALLGISVMTADILLITTLQQRFPQEHLGKALGGLMALSVSVQAVTMLAGGYLVQTHGLKGFLLTLSAILPVLALLAVVSNSLVRVRKPLQQHAAAQDPESPL